jgi:proteasome lid subunit RPN8/RPN11
VVFYFVTCALKTTYAQPVKKKGILKMNPMKQNKLLPEPTKAPISLPLTQPSGRSTLLTQRAEPRKQAPAALRFSPTAWAKLLYFRDRSDNEIGGFGISQADDLLFVRQFVTVKQQVSCVSVKFDDEAVADFFDQQVDLGRKPQQFARIWCHTHPSDCPQPSGVDEETFARVFGGCDWAVMFILADNDRTYVRLGFNVGPGGQILIPVTVDYSDDFGATDKQAWDAEYEANIKVESPPICTAQSAFKSDRESVGGCGLRYDFLHEFENMEPAERQLILDELAERPDLWDEKGEVMCL